MTVNFLRERPRHYRKLHGFGIKTNIYIYIYIYQNNVGIEEVVLVLSHYLIVFQIFMLNNFKDYKQMSTMWRFMRNHCNWPNGLMKNAIKSYDVAKNEKTWNLNSSYYWTPSVLLARKIAFRYSKTCTN